MIASKESFLSGEIILIDKPLEWTSFQVVNKIRWIIKSTYGVKKIKVGHAGTLDPLATGLLIICTGKMTKSIEQFMGQEKEYTNWFSELGGKLKEGTQDATQIYEQNPGEMNLFDSGYWFKNSVSISIKPSSNPAATVKVLNTDPNSYTPLVALFIKFTLLTVSLLLRSKSGYETIEIISPLLTFIKITVLPLLLNTV